MIFVPIDDLHQTSKEDIVTAILERWFHVQAAYEAIFDSEPDDASLRDELFGLVDPLVVPVFDVRLDLVNHEYRAVSSKAR